ncbi:kinase-like domain-containing protein [Cladorrhinum samala]|uniref:non-specific serine/threonine protein kinase n=1 Tax=Cladorrhinum samala TaxID=585594 RepID=A0AAV9HGC1_9PEZI|nr:kinase-like domain-containing protein [Cladorrhinum samala]
MAALSSDEGEIVEATSLPRSKKNGDVDRNGRPKGRYASREPDHDLASRSSAEGHHRRRSQSPRGWKRPRDDRDARDRRDPRQFRIHYEDAPRDERRHGRDLDHPSSRGSDFYDDRPSHKSGGRDHRGGGIRRGDDHNRGSRGRRDYDRSDYPDKRPRHHSRSPRGRNDKGRRDGGRYGSESRDADEHKYSAHVERRSQDEPTSKRTDPVKPYDGSKRDAKTDQGATVERGINGLAISGNGATPQQSAQDDDAEMDDFDPDAVMDQEAKERAEIERRRRAREAALNRVRGAATPSIQSLQAGDRLASTPGSTRQSTPGLQRLEVGTPQSNAISSPARSPGKFADVASPAPVNFADDSALINAHLLAKSVEEDGPSAADYDPTVDMQEDERRDELRHGNVGLHGDVKQPAKSAPPVEEENAGTKKAEDDDDDFDMFAEDFDDEKFAAPASSKNAGADESRNHQTTAGGNIEGDDKDGYYKIRAGEILDGRYQISTTLGRGMFSGVARAVDMTTKQVVAIKIMRNNDALRKGGFTEIAILQKLNAADPDNKKHLVRFERSFEYKGHLCMAFENLSMNLREVLKKFGNNVGINLSATRIYAAQIFIALGHMRKCSIIHADLKPDNILVNEARNVLKICDLGTAIDRSDAATASTEITPYLVSRFYRAPEIILGMPYDYAVDMWSIGCTLYELYTGKILFTGDSNNQMLKNIMEIRGKLSPKLYRRGQLSHMHFDEQGNFISVERDKILGKVCLYTVFFFFFFCFLLRGPAEPGSGVIPAAVLFLPGSFFGGQPNPSGRIPTGAAEPRACHGLAACDRLATQTFALEEVELNLDAAVPLLPPPSKFPMCISVPQIRGKDPPSGGIVFPQSITCI